ncbi:YcgN family cysteine cluster protein [Pseudidiomarina insulisalsae]|uniref:YcgN family cysteine cluster protein n=1 Tax=Pseudidiomarina insulisalsae TaxID=575789 RepID=A0A432YF02_9GAMM|nr:YcgN family cysteine cluster protein [Pseudidiomarina insulisalsae]RUO59533.1 YcgN family cysteine cluster protein [Pseudidiomarina insulisalsae]
MTDAPFWQRKSFAQMTHEEWESLCDGCGKCCLHKLIDSDDMDETVHYTDVSCVLLNTETAQCSNYAERTQHVLDCVVITPENVYELDFMPTSCAYRRLAEGRGLASWHPLLHGGSKAAMIAAGMSAAGRVLNEDEVHEDLELRIVTWPLNDQD